MAYKPIWRMEQEWYKRKTEQADTPEENTVIPPKARLPRVVHWKHHNGKWVVVAGPFPESFYRSETRDDPKKAAKITVDEIYNRSATSRDDQYAKVLASDILEIMSGENEFGPISP